jgi:hypothetical protein
VGGQGVLGGGDQGVPHPGTGITRVPELVVVVGELVVVVGVVVGGGGGCRGRQRQQRGFEQGAVLGGPASFDPDSAGCVERYREVAGEVGGAFLAVQLAFEASVLGVGVDHVDQVPAGAGQVGGVEVSGMLEEGLFAAGADRGAGREGLDGLHDHLGLLR